MINAILTISALTIALVIGVILEFKHVRRAKRVTKYDSKKDAHTIEIKTALNQSKSKGLEYVSIEEAEPSDFFSITWNGRWDVIDIDFVELDY